MEASQKEKSHHRVSYRCEHHIILHNSPLSATNPATKPTPSENQHPCCDTKTTFTMLFWWCWPHRSDSTQPLRSYSWHCYSITTRPVDAAGTDKSLPNSRHSFFTSSVDAMHRDPTLKFQKCLWNSETQGIRKNTHYHTAPTPSCQRRPKTEEGKSEVNTQGKEAEAKEHKELHLLRGIRWFGLSIDVQQTYL